MDGLTIGKVARRAGVGVETVRFYERQGLIRQPPRPPAGRFRTYDKDAILRIRFIRQAQELGFSLREIEELLSLRADPVADAAEVRARVLAKLEDVHAKIRQLARIRDALRTLIASCPGQGSLGCCSIIEALEPHEASNGSGAARKRSKRS